MVYLHTGPMGVYRACFFIARAGRAATPERNRSGNQPPILCILPLVAHQLACARKFRGSITRLLVSLSTPRGDGLPPLHARLASGCWSQLCRAGFQPAGFLRKVSEHQYSSSSPQLSWRELRFGAFLSPSSLPLLHWLLATDHWPLFSCHWPLFSRHSPFATRHYLPRPSPAGYCLTPTAGLTTTERGPISTIGRLYSVCHRTGRFLRRNQSTPPRSLSLNR